MVVATLGKAGQEHRMWKSQDVVQLRRPYLYIECKGYYGGVRLYSVGVTATASLFSQGNIEVTILMYTSRIMPMQGS